MYYNHEGYITIYNVTDPCKIIHKNVYKLYFKNRKEMIKWFAYDYFGKNIYGRILTKINDNSRYNRFIENQSLCNGDTISFGWNEERIVYKRSTRIIETLSNGYEIILDIRDFKDEIEECAKTYSGIFYTEKERKNLYTWEERYSIDRMKRGRAHKKKLSSRNTKGYKRCLKDDDINYIKEEYIDSDIKINVKKDKNFGYKDYKKTENNWKQKKCHSQWQWHKIKNTGNKHSVRGIKQDIKRQNDFLNEWDRLSGRVA